MVRSRSDPHAICDVIYDAACDVMRIASRIIDMLIGRAHVTGYFARHALAPAFFVTICFAGGEGNKLLQGRGTLAACRA